MPTFVAAGAARVLAAPRDAPVSAAAPAAPRSRVADERSEINMGAPSKKPLIGTSRITHEIREQTTNFT
jgi:hypothetical protein